MKKLFLLSLSLTACGIVAQASTVACTVITGGIVTAVGTVAKINAGGPLGTTAVFDCPGLDAGVGFNLTNVELLGTGDYDGGPFGTTSGTSVTEDFGVTSGPFSPTSDVILNITGGSSSSGTNIALPFELGSILNPGSETLPEFFVNLSSVVNTGSVAESSAQVQLSYSTQSTAGAPEPATLGLMGTSLVGLGFLARRRRKS